MLNSKLLTCFVDGQTSKSMDLSEYSANLSILHVQRLSEDLNQIAYDIGHLFVGGRWSIKGSWKPERYRNNCESLS